jgi:hypothetical protein
MMADSQLDVEAIFASILRKKGFPDRASPSTPEAHILKFCLYHIIASQQLVLDAVALKRIKYDKDNSVHEKLLMQVWEQLSDVPLKQRKSKQWQDIGFQGDDPSTDFRGSGLLGLHDLNYFGKKYTSIARSVLEASKDKVAWYTYAIVGINLTALAVDLLKHRHLQYFLFRYGTSMDIYHEFYCCLFYEFNKFWHAQTPKPTIMDFEQQLQRFRAHVEELLLTRRVVLLEELEQDRKND